MLTKAPETMLVLISAIAVIGIIVLTALGDTVPDVLNLVAIGALTGAGAIMPGRSPIAPE